LDDFREKYPAFQLEDELDFEGGEMSYGAAHTHVSGGPKTSSGPLSAMQQQEKARPAARPNQMARGEP